MARQSGCLSSAPRLELDGRRYSGPECSRCRLQKTSMYSTGSLTLARGVAVAMMGQIAFERAVESTAGVLLPGSPLAARGAQRAVSSQRRLVVASLRALCDHRPPGALGVRRRSSCGFNAQRTIRRKCRSSTVARYCTPRAQPGRCYRSPKLGWPRRSRCAPGGCGPRGSRARSSGEAGTAPRRGSGKLRLACLRGLSDRLALPNTCRSDDRLVPSGHLSGRHMRSHVSRTPVKRG
jgi:hypothetical protein